MSAALQHPTDRRNFPPRCLACLTALGLVLTACAMPESGTNPYLGWMEASSPKNLEVERAQYRHTVHFATDSAELTAVEQDRLLTFLQTVAPHAQDTMVVEGHADERATDLYNVELASRRITSVADFLRAQGLQGVPLRTSAFGERVPAAAGSGPAVWQQNRRVELVLERHVVELPPCPDWSRESGLDYSNLPGSNFGCATQTNLGLMIDNPGDLVRGRKLAPASGIHAAESIVRYRTGEVIELKEEELGN
ncbi:MAG TPA: CpaD family pilus assembly lipoprotein [Geminicoccaceae bacterium]|nr:CpaD family pilus assembly lipoprotein [Geminicoccaceae bacterium]